MSKKQKKQKSASPDLMSSAVSHDFERVGAEEIGYEPSHVDAFMDRARRAYEGEGELTVADVREARFATVDGGYATDQVDDALDRLEDALAESERERVVAEKGDAEWSSMLSQQSDELLARLDRPAGERFRRPSHAEAQSYATADVDELCERLAGVLRDPESGDDLSADDVRRASFGAAEGRAGYEEAQVDAFLDAAVDVLLRQG
ncbi:MAG: DivIVA domain-containing protein [Micrococcus sp.]|nr:DivIVA domain-containing protein [Micrococcus sp.]